MLTPTFLRRITALALALSLFAQMAPAEAATSRARASTNEVLVRLHPAADPQALGARAGLTLLDRIPEQQLYRFAITDGTSAREKAAGLVAYPGVVAADPNYEVVSPWAVRRVTWVVGSDAEGYAAQWAPARLGLDVAHAVTRGEGVTVAILDTGVDAQHPAFGGRLVGGHDFVDGDSDPREEGSADSDAAFGHGTHVAGLVALVAPGASILPLRTLAPDGSGDLWTQIVAMHYAVAQGATVINLSFSFGERSRVFEEALAAITCVTGTDKLCRGIGRGALVVAAAGNTGAAVREFPGASPVPGLLGVAASTEADTLASFSTFGPWLPLAAPGELIVSAVPGGGYAAWSGTSMATPLVAGTAALVRAVYPTLGAAGTARHIVETSAPLEARVRRRVDSAAAVGAVRGEAKGEANAETASAAP
jgi:subtilisin family serine protease